MSDGIEEVGYVQWDLLGYLILAWTVVYCVIWKGLHNSGKVRLLKSLEQTKVLEMCNLEQAACTSLMCMFHNFNVAVM